MNFTVYKSSAGSGKTFTLVRIYLGLILKQPEQYRHILAVTFTNKAANEMKERVLSQLRTISDWDAAKPVSEGTMMHQLQVDLKMDAAVLIRNASRAQELILHEYGNFSIGTIDSFMHRVVRTFAHDLQLPVNFEVELETDLLLTKSIDLLLNTAGSNDALTSLLMGFIEQKAEEEKSWQIEADLFMIARSLFNENDIAYLNSLQELTKQDFLLIIGKINKYRTEYTLKVQTEAKMALSLIANQGISESAFYQGTRGLPSYFKNLSEGKLDKLSPSDTIAKAVAESRMSGGKTTLADQHAIEMIWPDLASHYEKLQQLREQGYSRWVLYGMLSRTIYQMAVLHEINDNLKTIQLNKNIVPLAEFNKRIAKVVMREPAPFVYERLGERYHHYLIDEFQDTSVMQWQNLLPLVDNALGSGYYNLVVGDGKQSIYRWRGGEVMQFVNLPAVDNPTASPEVFQREQSLRRNYAAEKLSRNFRSKKEIVEFNNRFFEWLAERLPQEIKGVYADIAQDVDQDKTGGGVSFQFFDKNTAEITVEEYNIQQINDIISKLIEAGYRYSDIAILCRANRRASIIANDLLSREIPVISSESLLLSSSPKVGFIVNFIRWIQNPGDDVLASAILTRLLRQGDITAQDLHTILSGVSKKLTRTSSLQTVLPEILSRLGYHFEFVQFSKLHLIDLAEEIIRIFGLNKTDDAFLHFFLDAILTFSTARKENSLVDFSEWWEDKKNTLSLVVPEGINAVRIMTIHKSKGLQFPVVIYPFAAESINNRNDLKWISLEDDYLPELPSALLPLNEKLRETGFGEIYDKEIGQKMLDLTNLLYVVMTRPEERLYVISESYEGNQPDKSVAGLLKSFIVEKGSWPEGENTPVLFGAPLSGRATPEKEIAGNEPAGPMISSAWQDRILLSRRAPDNWDSANPEHAQEYGKMVHQLLSYIKSPDDFDNAISKFISEDICTDDEASKLIDMARKILVHPVAGSFFRPGIEVKNESELLLPDGKIYRPDRVVIDGNKAIVIDFKTGKASPYYHVQITNYAAILEQMGYKNVEKYLIYVDESLTVEQVN
ncbi:MAG: UvrD-helicase domain-containing protein [Bacteroidota bacterium]|nr:UvrD-helicase domain-containing protein [Bacteroidota bacterium]